jgi:hypothetical protein
MVVTFDTLKLAQRLEAAGMPPQQAQGVAGAFAETFGESVVTREYLDLRLSELRAELRGEIRESEQRLRGEIRESEQRLRAEIVTVRAEISETKAEILKWMFGAIGFQTLIIIGAVAVLYRLLH